MSFADDDFVGRRAQIAASSREQLQLLLRRRKKRDPLPLSAVLPESRQFRDISGDEGATANGAAEGGGKDGKEGGAAEWVDANSLSHLPSVKECLHIPQKNKVRKIYIYRG